MNESVKFLLKFFGIVLLILLIILIVDADSLPHPISKYVKSTQISLVAVIMRILPGSPVKLPSSQEYSSSDTSLAWVPPSVSPVINPKVNETKPKVSESPAKSNQSATPARSSSSSDPSEEGICIPNDPGHESPTVSREVKVTIVENQSAEYTANISEWERMFRERGATVDVRLHIVKTNYNNYNTSRTYPSQPSDLYVDLNPVNYGHPPGFRQEMIGNGKYGADFGNAVASHEAGHECLFAKGLMNKAYQEPLIEEYSHYWYGKYDLIVPK